MACQERANKLLQATAQTMVDHGIAITQLAVQESNLTRAPPNIRLQASETSSTHWLRPTCAHKRGSAKVQTKADILTYNLKTAQMHTIKQADTHLITLQHMAKGVVLVHATVCASPSMTAKQLTELYLSLTTEFRQLTANKARNTTHITVAGGFNARLLGEFNTLTTVHTKETASQEANTTCRSSENPAVLQGCGSSQALKQQPPLT